MATEIVIALIGVSGVVIGSVVTYMSQRRKTDAEATKALTDAALSLVEELRESNARQDELIVRQDTLIRQYLQRIATLMAGIRSLIEQLKQANIVPCWQPDEWDPTGKRLLPNTGGGGAVLIALTWPVYKTAPITQSYGENPGAGYLCMPDGSHNGVDFGVPIGTAVYATADGTVIRADLDETGYGLHVRIQHDGYMSLYGHLSTVTVKAGQRVTAGQTIAGSGNTGKSTGPHLHFEIRLVAGNCKSTVDPLYYLQHNTLAQYHGVVTPIGNGLRVRSAMDTSVENTVKYLSAGTDVYLMDLCTDAIGRRWGRLFDAGERYVCLHDGEDELVHLDGNETDPAVEPASDHAMLMKLWAAHPELH